MAEDGINGDGGEKQYTSDRLWTPYGDPARQKSGKRDAEEPPRSEDGEPGEEEYRRRLEEAMENVTVAEVILEILVSLSGLSYRLKGLPYELSSELYDPEKAEIIDACLDGIVGALDARIPDEARKAPAGRIPAVDLVLDMIVSLTSLAYRKMGIPPEVNEKYKDAGQARLAIDVIGAMLDSLKDRAPEDKLAPFVSTLDNLKLNYAREF